MKNAIKDFIMTGNLYVSICCLYADSRVAVLAVIKPTASLQSFSNHYIMPSKQSMLYSLRGLVNTNHTDMNKMKTFMHCFAVMVDVFVKRLACRMRWKCIRCIVHWTRCQEVQAKTDDWYKHDQSVIDTLFVLNRCLLRSDNIVAFLLGLCASLTECNNDDNEEWPYCWHHE